MSTKRWLPGTQCIAKQDHTKPKARELAFRKGDIVTIVEVCEQKGWYQAKHNDSGEEGLLSASSVREREAIRVDPKLSLMPWFHGKISGVEAVQALQPPEDGLFLVRESIRHPGDYVLCVSFGKEVIHYRVIYQENRLSIDASICFYNLIDMIEHYMKEQGAICTKLVKPKPKPGMKSAEEELAKAGWLLKLQHLTLGDKIGEGEFGAVLQGEYMGQKVAVKNIKCDVTAQAFLSETAAMTKVRHKNLVQLLGVILHNGLYIVMEFMSKVRASRAQPALLRQSEPGAPTCPLHQRCLSSTPSLGHSGWGLACRAVHGEAAGSALAWFSSDWKRFLSGRWWVPGPFAGNRPRCTQPLQRGQGRTVLPAHPAGGAVRSGRRQGWGLARLAGQRAPVAGAGRAEPFLGANARGARSSRPWVLISVSLSSGRGTWSTSCGHGADQSSSPSSSSSSPWMSPRGWTTWSPRSWCTGTLPPATS
ncbi:megakaryocyte-associated tyrosine-protein kinase isoform 1-T2 [Macrochelys suwanniensis]